MHGSRILIAKYSLKNLYFGSDFVIFLTLTVLIGTDECIYFMGITTSIMLMSQDNIDLFNNLNLLFTF